MGGGKLIRDVLFWGVVKRGKGVKKIEKSTDVVYGLPLKIFVTLNLKMSRMLAIQLFLKAAVMSIILRFEKFFY